MPLLRTSDPVNAIIRPLTLVLLSSLQTTAMANLFNNSHRRRGQNLADSHWANLTINPPTKDTPSRPLYNDYDEDFESTVDNVKFVDGKLVKIDPPKSKSKLDPRTPAYDSRAPASSSRALNSRADHATSSPAVPSLVTNATSSSDNESHVVHRLSLIHI